MSDLTEKEIADLERWFGKPSFEQLADEGKQPPLEPVEDTEEDKIRKQRAEALAAVSPAMLAELDARATNSCATFRALIDVHVDPSVAKLDLDMLPRAAAEPRELELPVEMEDDLKECAPQALLRDLHRAEFYFDKTFEMVDPGAADRVDASELVAAAMRTSVKLPPIQELPSTEARALIDGIRAERRTPWPALWTRQPLPNRSVE